MQESIQLIAVVGLAMGVLMTILWRGATARTADEVKKGAATHKKLAAAETSLEKERKARQRQAEELAEFRKRADKAKRRGGKQAAQPMGTASRIGDLEEACERTRLERDRAAGERDGIAAELAKLRTEIAAEARMREKAAAERAASEQRSAEPVVVDDPLEVATSQLAEAREQLEKLRSEQVIARQSEVRMRKRMDTQEQLYASVRSELEVKKDRLRTQEEQLQRLQALKVAVID